MIILPEVYRVAVVSTGEWSDEDVKRHGWPAHDEYPVLMSGAGEGYLVHVGAFEDDSYEGYLEELKGRWSDKFIAILHQAHEEGITYVKFDPDGPKVIEVDA